MNWGMDISDYLRDLAYRGIQGAIKVGGIVVILILGWIIAKAIQKGITRVLKGMKLDNIADQLKISDFLSKGNIKYSLSELLGILFYWTLMLIVFITCLNALDLAIVASLLDRLVLFIPKVISAIFILILGMFAATFIGKLVQASTASVGIGQSKLLGNLSQVVTVVFSIAIALEQLGIATFVIGALNIIIGAAALALGLSFGLGCKDIAGKYVGDIVSKVKKS